MYLLPQTSAPPRPMGSYLTGAALSRRRRRLSYLGQPINASGQAAVNASGAAGQIVKADGSAIYVPGSSDCSQSTSVAAPALIGAASAAGGLLLKFGAANPIALGVGAGLEVGSAIWGAIFGHHAAAVGKEQSVLCAAVPAANQALQVIDQGVQSGQLTPQQALAALQSLVSGFQNAVSSILKMNSSQCNAACVMIMALKAAVATRTMQYTALVQQQAQQAAAAAAAAQQAGQNAAAPNQPAITNLQTAANALIPISTVQAVQSEIVSAGLPNWLLPAAAFFLLWELL